jgi:hypothetical protein
MYGEEERCIQAFDGDTERKKPLEDLGVEGKTIID